ncbi:uncharacterized protein LOC101860617 isoform X2 [Aplysia californica]|uniref:Uncharacterized protein LOC101860617 isoform X2 n=1 Tax=Aplysia californica TaxID=6500 RepID=A0ABM1W2U1_APLCA|nr:uncharacterized protein LOC101860617 isoform X2 [Aplysia californica]
MKACVQTIVLGLLLCLFRGSSCDYRNNEIDSNARENGEDEFSELPLPVTPLSARREETEEGVVYTVRYVRQRGVRESIMWENDDEPDGFSREIMSNSIPAYNRGYQETKYLTRNGTNSYVTLYIYTETYWLVVTLLNNGQGNQTSRIEAPKMKIEPASRDLPYTVGENATFTPVSPLSED